jgi:hypothetical protein
MFRRNKTTPDLRTLTSTSTSRLPNSSSGRRRDDDDYDDDGNNSMMETRSTVTWLAKRDRMGEKCALM